MPRRKYLLIADPFHPKALPAEAGVNTFLATALAARGWEVAVWTSAGSTLPPDSLGLRLVRTVDYWGPAEILRIAFWIAFNRPARIGLLYFSDMYSARGFVTLVPLLARMLGIPCATLFTNNQRPKGRGFLVKLLAWLGRRDSAALPLSFLGFSSALVFYSHRDRMRLLEFSRPELWARTALCNPPSLLPSPGCFDSNACREALGAAPGEFLIGFFGMFYPGKSVETLLNAAQILCNRGVAVKVALIGASDLSAASIQIHKRHQKYQGRLRDLIRSAGIEDRVAWTGYVAPLQTVRLISSCDLICLPYKEGLTSTRSSFIECARLGVPVVTTRSEVTDAFLRRDDSGITFVSPQNPSDLADAMLRLQNDPDERARRSGLIKRFAETYCGSRALVDSLEACRVPGVVAHVTQHA